MVTLNSPANSTSSDRCLLRRPRCIKQHPLVALENKDFHSKFPEVYQKWHSWDKGQNVDQLKHFNKNNKDKDVRQK